MLGRHHLLLSLATVSCLLVPFLDEYPGFVLLAFFGTAVGSLIPDVDSHDAAIFHENVKGLNGDVGIFVNNFFAPVFPVFGYVTKYLIYKPVVHLYDRVVFRKYSFKEKHRSFSHSILGVVTMTLLTGIYVTLALAAVNLFSPLALAVFLSSYASGAFLHMLEDSCTRTGIAWNSPFSSTKLRGELVTSAKPEHVKAPRRFTYFLGVFSVVFLLADSLGKTVVPGMNLPAAVFIFTFMSWAVFLKYIAGAEVSR